MSRIALHQSLVHPMDPVQLVTVAEQAGLGSIGLRVAAVDDEREWWSKGIGSAMLRDLAAALVASDVTVLDVGRIELGPELRIIDSRHAYLRALELGVRLGARFVTVRTRDESTEEPRELFAILAELAGRYQMRPLLSVVPRSSVDSLTAALEVVGGTGGGVVLDVSPLRDDPASVAGAVARLGAALGYVRVPARELTEPGAGAGLLHALRPEVAVAIGSAPSDAADTAGLVTDGHVTRLRTLRLAVEGMLGPASAPPPVTEG